MALMNVKDLHKRYPGVKALCGTDMEIKEGQIVGLLGPNTSGKTTLLKTMAGLLSPDAGEITYPNGAKGLEAKLSVSFLPDAMIFPTWMKVRDAFGYYKDMYPDYSLINAGRLTQMLELPSASQVCKLSKGMRERLALALTFSRNTSLYLLDEPLGGIDPLGKMKILETILATPLDNSSILISTHLVKDVETVFDSVFFLSGGKIIYSGNCEEMREKHGKTVEQMYLEVFSNVKTA